MRRYCLLFFALASILSGCAEGPAPDSLSLNPQLRKQWQDDELYRPTLHRQLTEVEALRDGASGLSATQQRHWSGEMQHIVQTDDNPLLRAAAVDTLAEFAVPEANEGLRLAMKDSDTVVRRAACRAWGKRGDSEALERLSEILGSDVDADVRIEAARELGHFSEPLAHQALGLALQDRDPALQHRAVESLRQSTGKDFGNDLDAWQAYAQGQDPGPEYTPSLAERLHQLF